MRTYVTFAAFLMLACAPGTVEPPNSKSSPPVEEMRTFVTTVLELDCEVSCSTLCPIQDVDYEVQEVDICVTE